MANIIARFRMWLYDAPSAKTNAASFTYWIGDGVPFWDHTAELMPYWMEKLHETVGFAVRGLMSPDTQIIKYTSRLWAENEPGSPVEGSHYTYSVPQGLRAGVYNRAELPPLGQNPKVNFTLRYGNRWEIEPFGEGLKRGRSIQLFAATDAFDYFPPLLFASVEAQAICDALTAPFSLENIPILELPELTAYPVVAKFDYDDELLSADPDASNNDALTAYKPVVSCTFSLTPRYPRKNRFNPNI